MKELYHGVETTRGTFVVGHRDTAQSKWLQYAVSELFRFCYTLVVSVGLTGYYFDNTLSIFFNCCIH